MPVPQQAQPNPTRPPTPPPAALPTTPTSPPATETAPTVTAEQIDALRQQVANSAELEDAAKERVAELCKLATEHLNQVTVFIARQQDYEKRLAAAEQDAAALQKRLEMTQPPFAPASADAELPALEQQLSAAEAEVKDIRDKLLAAEAAVQNSSERKKEIRSRLSTIAQTLETVAKQLADRSATANPAVAQAQQYELATQQLMLKAEKPAIEAELQWLDAQDALDLARLTRDALSRDLTVAEKQTQQLLSIVQQERTNQANKQAADARDAAERERNPLFQQMAQRNVELAEAYEAVVGKLRSAEASLTEAKATRDKLRLEADNAESKVKAIGLTNAVGSMLRKLKLSLPSRRRLRAAIKSRTQPISDAQFELLELEDERAADLSKSLLLKYDTDVRRLDDSLKRHATDIITKRNELLSPLIRTQSSYFDTLVELSNTQEQTLRQVQEFRDFVDERILWVQSSKPITDRDSFANKSPRALTSLNWQNPIEVIRQDAASHPALYALGILIPTLLLLLRPRWKKRLEEWGHKAEKRTCLEYWPTVQTLIGSILLALPIPLSILFVAWRLYLAEGADEMTRALTQGLQTIGFVSLPLAFLFVVTRKYGLASSHFEWSATTVDSLRRALRILLFVGLPLAFASTTLIELSATLGNDAVGRLCFAGLMLTAAVVAWRVFHPRVGAFHSWLSHNSDGWLDRLWPFIWVSMICIPIMFAVLSLMGYHFTARALTAKLRESVGILAIFGIVAATLTRLLVVQRRRLNVEQARKKRAAMQLTEEEAKQQKLEIVPHEELQAQISQSRRLVRFAAAVATMIALWFVWSDVVPALNFLEKWPLWQSSQQITESVTSETGAVSYATRDVIDNVTIADLILAIIIGIVTFVATRNIPGFLELSVLKKLPIESSIRYAIRAVVSYLIALVGIILAFGVIGIHWKQVQWLATALTFGLAFGLQEMFANFVAGIIILFERPIRVGDIVTLDGVAGTVTKIRMRATTITNFDRQDYIVPNKDFITGRVLNWTLSDYVSRIVIPVGVAYGSDTEKTVATLMRMADEHEQIIDDPKPQVTFEEFGDSSLLFKLRVFIAMEHMPHRLQIIHQLHMAIDAAFREVGIEIAFPQRDLHIRTSMPLAEPKGAAADQKSNPGNGTFGERANKDRIK